MVEAMDRGDDMDRGDSNPPVRREGRRQSIRILLPCALVCAAFGSAALLGLHRRGDGALRLFASGPWFEAKTLTEFEAYEVLSHRTFTATCVNVSFGYCGKATCRVAADGLTASCGCYALHSAVGVVLLSANDRYLVASAIVRRALYEFVHGDDALGDTILCDAARKGTLWSSAGFGESSRGSFSVTEKSGAFFPTNGTSCNNGLRYNFADCDGAPCDLDAAFDDTYNATCLCPVRDATRFALIDTSLEQLTALSCEEVLASGQCAVQGTFSTSNPIIRSWEDMKKYRSALLTADFEASDGVCGVAS